MDELPEKKDQTPPSPQPNMQLMSREALTAVPNRDIAAAMTENMANTRMQRNFDAHQSSSESVLRNLNLKSLPRP